VTLPKTAPQQDLDWMNNVKSSCSVEKRPFVHHQATNAHISGLPSILSAADRTYINQQQSHFTTSADASSHDLKL
jgi:hypothetical protein